MTRINVYDLTLVFDLVSPASSDPWIISWGQTAERDALIQDVAVPEDLRQTLGPLQSGDRIRGTMVCEQYLTEQGALIQQARLVSAA